MKILETARLALRRLTPEDAPFILELLNDPLFLRFVGDKGIRTLEGARDYIINGPMASYAQHGFGLFHVSLRHEGTPIGMCGLLKREALEDVDVGFAYLPQFSGQGYATEAARATLDYGRGVLGLKRIVAITAPDNAGSQNVLRKIGLRHEKTLRLPAYQTDSLLFTPAAE
ncbi:MAG TPA: GNAT family N-acetyltransferase [Lacunisphaera sp.]